MYGKKIEIHGKGEDGGHFVLNHFSSENAGTLNERDRQKLLDEAQRMVGKWQHMYPHDKIFIAEV